MIEERMATPERATGVGKNLNEKSREEFASIVRDLVSLRKENALWLDAKLKGDAGIEETLAYFKKKIKNAFFNRERPNLNSYINTYPDPCSYPHSGV